MLRPRSDWYWFSENSQLKLSMGKDWQCTTAYGQQQIVDLPKSHQLFSLSDTECYLGFADQLLNSSGKFSDAQLTHIVINATAATMFHKPVTPKSWLFYEIDSYGVHHSLAKVSNGFNSGVVLLLTDEHALATCMLMSSQFQLSEKKSLNQFDLIKLAKTRLEPLFPEASSQLTA
ncbi:cell division protein ZapC domain-containing protein [uncultured Paraglaciecola sp.]|uniref:cell division protein ZapC domain-containing protein n=1 Tax=uncultured Paraglaciecola sp. TaxID=1765024 RepID=UPI0026045BC9|nr:cell division protein ZapC domain-containing protein [uncultured Paraglaciecola sp.]